MHDSTASEPHPLLLTSLCPRDTLSEMQIGAEQQQQQQRVKKKNSERNKKLDTDS